MSDPSVTLDPRQLKTSSSKQPTDTSNLKSYGSAKPGNGNLNLSFEMEATQSSPGPLDPEMQQSYYLNDSSEDEDCQCCSYVTDSRSAVATFLTEHSKVIETFVKVILVLGYIAYFSYAMVYQSPLTNDDSLTLLGLTCFGFGVAILIFISKCCGESIGNCTSSCWESVSKHTWLYGLTVIILALLYFGFSIINAIFIEKEIYNLVSLGGIFSILFVGWLFSSAPTKVAFRTVFNGLMIQYVFALFVIKTQAGQDTFNWLGERVTEFLAHTDAGSEFIFGPNFRDHFFAFSIMPVIVFFSAIVSMLYYIGVMQFVVKILASSLGFLMGTTPGESTSCSANIFVGQTEAPLLIAPFLPNMTESEIFAVMTGGFATIAGSVLGAYIAIGVPANHLIAASVMAAPGALLMAKLVMPETEKSTSKLEDMKNVQSADAGNIIEAACNGASQSISLVANVLVNLLAVTAILHFVDGTLAWAGARVGFVEPPLSFELITGYLFYPVAFLIGVPLEDCQSSAQLIGTKLFANEFLAFERLGKFIENNGIYSEYIATTPGNDTMPPSLLPNGDIFLPNQNVTLVGGVMYTQRAIYISTYALCGFANFASVGVQIGGLSAMVPAKKRVFAKLALKSMLTGTMVNLLTASVAGLLLPSDSSIGEFDM